MKKIFILFSLVFFFLVNFSSPLLAFPSSHNSSMIVYERNSKRILYENNIHESFLTASIAKIMTAMVAIENANLFEMVTIDKTDTLMEGSKVYLTEGDSLLFIELIYGLMLQSGNDAANAIARLTFNDYEAFIHEMNDMARKIGMKNSVFENPTGLDGITNNYSSAYDMALLTDYALNNAFFKTISGTKKYSLKTNKGRNYLYLHKHRLIHNDPAFVMGKTGYTKKSQRTLVSNAKNDDLDLIIVTFKDSSDFRNHQNMAHYVFDNYEQYKIINRMDLIKNELIDYEPELDTDIFIPLKESEIKDIKVIVVLKAKKEEIFGVVEVYREETLILRRELKNT